MIRSVRRIAVALVIPASAVATVVAGWLEAWADEARATYHPDISAWEFARDRADILEVLNRHQIYVDSRDVRAYSELFAEDGVYESHFGSAQGRDEIAAMSERLHASGFTAGMRHFGGPALIELDGTLATALSYWMVVDTSDAPSISATGVYRDELRKRDGRWEIVRRILEQDGQQAEE